MLSHYHGLLPTIQVVLYSLRKLLNQYVVLDTGVGSQNLFAWGIKHKVFHHCKQIHCSAPCLDVSQVNDSIATVTVTTRQPRQQRQHGCHLVNTATTTTAFENMFFFLFESIFLKNHMFPMWRFASAIYLKIISHFQLIICDGPDYQVNFQSSPQ